MLDQRCPKHSTLATCGELPFKCGEWLCFQILGCKNFQINLNYQAEHSDTLLAIPISGAYSNSFVTSVMNVLDDDSSNPFCQL